MHKKSMIIFNLSAPTKQERSLCAYIYRCVRISVAIRARAHWPLCLATYLFIRDIYSRRKPLFSSFGEHTAVCGSSVRQAVARPRHRQSVCIHNIHVAATCRPSVLGSATMRGHMWLNKVASVLGPLSSWLAKPFLYSYIVRNTMNGL